MFFHVSEWEAAGCIYRGNHRLTHSRKKGGNFNSASLFFCYYYYSFNRWVAGWQLHGEGPLITSHSAPEAGQMMIHGFAPIRQYVLLLGIFAIRGACVNS